MIDPTNEALLRRISANARLALEAHGPGWRCVAPGEWELRPSFRIARTWETGEYGESDLWLPCTPSAIMDVAMAIHGGLKPGWMLSFYEDGHEACVAGTHSAPDAVGRARETDNLEAHGGNPHEAALKLLLLVCELTRCSATSSSPLTTTPAATRG